MDSLIFEHKVRIQDTEMDLNCNMKLSSLMVHFQNVGTEQLNSLGFTYDYLCSKNIVFLLSKMKIAIYRSPKQDELVTFKTWPKCISGVLYYRDYMVCAENGDILAEAASSWTAVDIAKRKILRPSNVDIKFSCIPEYSVSIGEIDKIIIPEGMKEAYTKVIRYSDLDANRHMNNTVYADVISDAIPELTKNKRIKNITIYYRSECVAGDSVIISTANVNGVYYINGKNGERESFEAMLNLSD